MTPTRPPTRSDWLIGAVLCLLATVVTSAASSREGFTRDEGYYFEAAELYYGWYGEIGDAIVAGHPLRPFSRASVDRWFSYNHEHPALMKTLYGWSWRLLHRCDCPRQVGHPVGYSTKHRTLGLLSEAQALRLPAAIFAGLMVMMAYLLGAQAWSRRVGVVAAVLALAAPRIFFNAQLAAFDAPMATTWLGCIYAYWRALDEPRWRWRAGVAFGLAMATKHNAFFLPFVLLAHFLVVEVVAHRSIVGVWRAILDTFRREGRTGRARGRVFLWMAVLGPVVEIGHWPWLWFDTRARIAEYLGFHLHHVYYNMEFLGANYNKPPFPKTFPFTMTLLTAPVTTLALALVGSVALVALFLAARRATAAATPDERRTTLPGLLVGLNALFPLAIIAFTGAPIFGATKHWLPAIPFIALLAGLGVDTLARLLGRALDWPTDGSGARNARLAGFALAGLACLPAVAETARSHPYGLSHYNLLAGGPAGGADLGMNRQFWGYATRGLLPWIDRHAPPNAQIYWHDTNRSILNMNVREHLMRPDLNDTGLEEPGVKASNLALVIHEKHFNKYEYWIWDFYHTTRPSVVLTHEGVPIVTLYERPKP